MASKKSQTKDSETPSLFVKSRPAHFYRAGIRFTQAGQTLALDALTGEQLEAIRNEPLLIVEDSAQASDEDAG